MSSLTEWQMPYMFVGGAIQIMNDIISCYRNILEVKHTRHEVNKTFSHFSNYKIAV